MKNSLKLYIPIYSVLLLSTIVVGFIDFANINAHLFTNNQVNIQNTYTGWFLALYFVAVVTTIMAVAIIIDIKNSTYSKKEKKAHWAIILILTIALNYFLIGWVSTILTSIL